MLSLVVGKPVCILESNFRGVPFMLIQIAVVLLLSNS